MTLDNACLNKSVVSFLKTKTKYRKDTILKYELLHVQYCAHILNLIVCEGLKEYDDFLTKIINIIKYVKSSKVEFIEGLYST